MDRKRSPGDERVRAIEENTAEFLLALGRAGGGHERLEPGLTWTVGGSPIDYHNAVVRAHLTPAEADRAIVEFQNRCAVMAVPGSWHICPSMRPADLPARLLANGFLHGGDEPGMAIDLRALPAGSSVPGLSITPIRDAGGLAAWVETLGQGFGEGPREAEWVGAMYTRLGYGDGTPWRHYLGRLDGRPVATATMFLGAGVAGIYFVSTVAEARRMGIGGAITLGALRDARERGYELGILTSSNMGESVYRRLGFEEYCRIGIYEWRRGSSTVASTAAAPPEVPRS